MKTPDLTNPKTWRRKPDRIVLDQLEKFVNGKITDHEFADEIDKFKKRYDLKRAKQARPKVWQCPKCYGVSSVEKQNRIGVI